MLFQHGFWKIFFQNWKQVKAPKIWSFEQHRLVSELDRDEIIQINSSSENLNLKSVKTVPGMTCIKGDRLFQKLWILDYPRRNTKRQMCIKLERHRIHCWSRALPSWTTPTICWVNSAMWADFQVFIKLQINQSSGNYLTTLPFNPTGLIFGSQLILRKHSTKAQQPIRFCLNMKKI